MRADTPRVIPTLKPTRPPYFHRDRPRSLEPGSGREHDITGASPPRIPHRPVRREPPMMTLGSFDARPVVSARERRISAASLLPSGRTVVRVLPKQGVGHHEVQVVRHHHPGMDLDPGHRNRPRQRVLKDPHSTPATAGGKTTAPSIVASVGRFAPGARAEPARRPGRRQLAIVASFRQGRAWHARPRPPRRWGPSPPWTR